MIIFMQKKDRMGLRTWVEIDKSAIKHNYNTFRAFISKTVKFMSVVKSNAYGHNLVDFAKEQEKLGADYLAVDSVVEGLALRKEEIKKPILVLGYTLPEMFSIAGENNIEVSISNFDYFTEINKLKLKTPLKVHIKIDSGMHRHGFQVEEIKKVITEIKNSKNIEVVGLYTHFAAAKNPAFPKQTQNQINIFNTWREAFKKAEIKVITHTCATSGTIIFPEAHFDMVRVGIGLYGIWPSVETKAFINNKFILKPVLSWKTLVAEIKEVKNGEKIGYDFTEKLEKNSRIAILPIGYWHGFPRALSAIGQVIINGQKAKILGRVCMDIVMVDVTHIKGVKVGDEVTIIGRDGSTEVSVDDIAGLIEGSSYEIVTRINPLIKRIYK
jgi:alanine racemase